MVCTPPSTHAGVVAELLQGGIDVLCEKPLAPSSAEAVAMQSLAAAQGRTLLMATKFRCVRDVQIARQRIQSGEIGDLILTEIAFAGQIAMGDRWNSNPLVSGGGVIADNGAHGLDLARYILGDLESTLASEAPGSRGWKWRKP